MSGRVLVMGWAMRNSEYYVRELHRRGDARQFTVRMMDWQHLRGMSGEAEVILLGPLDMYDRPEVLDAVELACLTRGIQPQWDSTDRLLSDRQ